MTILENIQVHFGGLSVLAQEPWPKDVKLFQPLEMEQILLPENANCLAVQAFLKMCGLPYEVEPRANAEFMSPSGKVPFIKCGAFVISELEGIVHFVSKKEISLTFKLDEDQKSELRAYTSLIRNVLEIAELYICWCDSETYNEVTKPRHGKVYPWPLNLIQTWVKKYQVINHLKSRKWYEKSLEDVYEEVEKCCKSLSIRLEKQEGSYFFGSEPCELDALIYGHILSILTFPLPSPKLKMIVEKYKNLVDHSKNVHNLVLGAISNIFVPKQKYCGKPRFEENPGDKSILTSSTIGSELIDADFDNSLLSEYQII